MKNTLILVGILAAALMAGCSSDNGSSTSTSTSGSSGGSTTGQSTTGSSTSTSGSGGSSGSSTSGSGGSSGSIPTPPTLGSQIDRMGRPAINTALTDPFNLDGNEDANKDAYNSESNPANWASVSGNFAQSLAILDGLDANCGNQAFAGAALQDGGAPADRYATLAGVLTNDRLWLNTNPDIFPDGGVSCTAYLAVEANATGFLTNNDCGGRAPTYDVIDESYSVLAAGAISGVTDGVDQSGHPGVSDTSFPFLAAPSP